MKEPKTYHIQTFEQLLNVVNQENCERLMTDFTAWIKMYLQLIAELKEQHPGQLDNYPNYMIADASFIWVDDGKNDFLGGRFIDGQTGEITYIKPDDK